MSEGQDKALQEKILGDVYLSFSCQRPREVRTRQDQMQQVPTKDFQLTSLIIIDERLEYFTRIG